MNNPAIKSLASIPMNGIPFSTKPNNNVAANNIPPTR